MACLDVDVHYRYSLQDETQIGSQLLRVTCMRFTAEAMTEIILHTDSSYLICRPIGMPNRTQDLDDRR